MRDSFVFYRSWVDSIKKLPKTQQLDLFLAIFDYALDDKETELTGTSKIIYDLVKPLLEANTKRYKDGCKGGRPKDEDSPRKVFEDYETVIITESQWEKTIAKYGERLALKMVEILDNWLSLGGANAKQYIGRNNYGHFRKDYWVYVEAKKAIEEEDAQNQPNWSV